MGTCFLLLTHTGKQSKWPSTVRSEIKAVFA